jgi:hypothetical protein
MTGTLTLNLGLDEPRTRPEGRRAPRTRPAVAAPAPAPRSQAPRTLDDLISGAWEDLATHRTVACPVCTGPMAPRYGSGARPVGGRCRRCGSTLG